MTGPMRCSSVPPRKQLALAVLILCLSTFLVAQTKPAPTPQVSTKVPFVGCASDGQVGPRDAPKGDAKSVSIPPDAASHLAYYKGEDGIGVLAPRGWHCFETYGSSGNNLYVFPDAIDPELLFSTIWTGFTGPVIQVSGEDGGTSGRFGVAETIARVFPAHRAFVRSVIKENIRPVSDFPYGPYPKDKLTYKNREAVEFQTPPNTKGLGTQSRLAANDSPIEGAAILLVPPADPDYDLFLLFVRLPPGAAQSTPAIIHQVEHDAASSNP
jgi:hypothetical protein